MRNPTILCFLTICFAIWLTVDSCQSPPPRTDKTDSLQTAQIDSIRHWVWNVEKEQRVDQMWAEKDYRALKNICDSMAKERPRDSKVWRRIGLVIGGIAERVVPGL